MSGDFSPLCKNCKTCDICHEPEKYVAQSCMHFRGELPGGYFWYRYSAVKFVENHWRGHAGYLVRKWGREWIAWWQYNELSRQRREVTRTGVSPISNSDR